MDASSLVEDLALVYLTHDGDVFACPQFRFGEGQPNPDALALDFVNKLILVVEVSTGQNVQELGDRISSREERWYAGLRRLVSKLGLGEGWRLAVHVFVTESSRTRLLNRIGGEQEDVCVTTIEKAISRAMDWRIPRDVPGVPR